MRIVSGKYKGRRFNPPRNITARPTTDFAKESLFNVLNNRIYFEAINVLDLFAGIGSISLEFISRGCENVTAIEQNRLHVNFAKKVCGELGVKELNLIQGDVFKFLSSTAMQFDLIFADPPYQIPEMPQIPDLVLKNNLLKEEGLFILEHSAKISFEEHPRYVEHRKYGNVNFSFFQ